MIEAELNISNGKRRVRFRAVETAETPDAIERS
jgi:hypothetical protein